MSLSAFLVSVVVICALRTVTVVGVVMQVEGVRVVGAVKQLYPNWSLLWSKNSQTN